MKNIVRLASVYATARCHRHRWGAGDQYHGRSRCGVFGFEPVDYNFVAQANLGAPFQIDLAGLPRRRPLTPAYATTHI